MDVTDKCWQVLHCGTATVNKDGIGVNMPLHCFRQKPKTMKTSR